MILGAGGRESAIARKLAHSTWIDALFIAPPHYAFGSHAQRIDINPCDFPAIKDFVLKNDIRIVVVGPEEPLVRGIYDFFRDDKALKDVYLIGPSKAGARLEGSKDFAKAFMTRHNIPTAKYRSFTAETLGEGVAFLKSLKPPYVLKADGLAAGKGVLILDSLEQAEAELKKMLDGMFGDASKTVVIEEFLDGIECSVFIATDGKDYIILPVAKDYKRIGEGNTGPNTGGMGAVTPVRFADEAFMQKVEDRIIRPTVEGLKAENIEYKGFLFFGLINVGGEPYVIEYNCRLGDPEAEVILPCIDSDFLDMLEAIGDGTLSRYPYSERTDTYVTVVLVSEGYPGPYEKGKEIHVSSSEYDPYTEVFYAGITSRDGRLYTNGGRVMAVTGKGFSLHEARKNAYRRADQITFEGKYCRRDIGLDLLR